MVLNIDTLTRNRESAINQATAILSLGNERALTDAERTQFDELMTQSDRMQADIERSAKLEQSVLERAATKPPSDDLNPPSDRTTFRSAGEFLQAVRTAGTPGAVVDPRLLQRAATGLSEGVPSDGGYLVTKDFETALLKRTYETGVLASRVVKREVSGNGLVVNGVDETSRATGSRWGGVRAYWQDEAAAYTASAPKFRQIELKLKKLTGLYYSTEELLMDAVALEAEVQQAFAEEFGWLIDDAIVNGTGAGRPLGILNSPALVSVAKETGQTAATLVPENLVKMWSRMWAKSRGNAVWYINQDIEPQLFTIAITVGTGGSPIYMPPGGLSAAPYGTLFGRPVMPIEQCATLGTVGDIILADLSQYRWIDKGSIASASSIHVRFLYDETAFRFTYRADGQPSWQSALTPANGSNTLSPFVALATRS